jgi:hypothetical protein
MKVTIAGQEVSFPGYGELGDNGSTERTERFTRIPKALLALAEQLELEPPWGRKRTARLCERLEQLSAAVAQAAEAELNSAQWGVVTDAAREVVAVAYMALTVTEPEPTKSNIRELLCCIDQRIGMCLGIVEVAEACR